MVHKITDKDFEQCEYPYDVRRIVEVAHKFGVVLSPLEAERAWSDYSDSMAAGWMHVPEDDTELWWSLPSWARGD